MQWCSRSFRGKNTRFKKIIGCISSYWQYTRTLIQYNCTVYTCIFKSIVYRSGGFRKKIRDLRKELAVFLYIGCTLARWTWHAWAFVFIVWEIGIARVMCAIDPSGIDPGFDGWLSKPGIYIYVGKYLLQKNPLIGLASLHNIWYMHVIPIQGDDCK